MGRKKKIEEEFVPSSYQLKIFDFVEHGQGNAVVEAVPGAGKTVTLTKLIKYIPKGSKILLTAFNTDIVDELKKKIKKEKIDADIDCRTIHSLGYSILMKNFGKEIDRQPNDFKYPSYIYNNIKDLGGKFYSDLAFRDRKNYIDNIKKLVDFGRYYLCQSEEDLNKIADKYSFSLYGNEPEVALKVMEWGKLNYYTIDFTDMVWLPIVLHCKPYGHIYDWILCDECNDLEKEEQELLLACTKMGTRMIFVGEEKQAIYAFKGSNSESFNELRNLPNTISLPLSISYRCAKNIVKYANRFNSKMLPKDNAIDGEVKNNVEIEEIQDGDMVLCRVNAPLLQMYCELSKLGKLSTIRGKDIGKDLIKSIKASKEEMLFQNLNHKGVFSHLYNKLFDEIDRVMKKHAITFEMACDDPTVTQEYDNIQALEVLSDGLTTTEELVDKINNLFSDKKAKGIQLSTIHKAKGLEADNVFICCPSLMPAKSATKDWELQQEANLEYVAYTRAKKKLCFLNEDNFTMYSSNAGQKANILASKKGQVFSLYGSSTRCGIVVPNKRAAREIISNSTDITVKPKNASTLGTKPKVFNSLSAFQNKKKVKRRIKI